VSVSREILTYMPANSVYLVMHSAIHISLLLECGYWKTANG